MDINADNVCFLVADLHGSTPRYERLLQLIEKERPQAVFVAGDILPHFSSHGSGRGSPPEEFIGGFLAKRLQALQARMRESYPLIGIILGNDDPRAFETDLLNPQTPGLWTYLHDTHISSGGYDIFGYAHVPPSPFPLKDWERYDVSRYVDPGGVAPEDGLFSVEVDKRRLQHTTIAEELDALTGTSDLRRSVFLFHTPPYQTLLDRAGLDGQMVDHVPMDCHVGSIAVRRMIEQRTPLLTLHGHVHESARLTGGWRDRIGETHMFSAAHDGAELALVRFRLGDLDSASRELFPVD